MPPPTDSHPSTATLSTFVSETEPAILRRRALPALIFALTALAACGGGDLFLPQDGAPAQISIVNGNNQTGTVGQPLGDPLVVRVTDTETRPVKDVEVVFIPPAGAAVAPNDTVLTDSKGEAAVFYTLSTTAGEQMVEARATPIVPSPSSSATFKASAEPEAATTLVLAGGDGQSAQVSTVLPESLAVRAVDRFGNGVAGIEVSWKAEGGGEVNPASVTTGPDGRAATALTLGAQPGPYDAEAEAQALEGSPVSFTATAVAAPTPQLVLVTQPSSEAQAGVPLARQPELQLQDPLGAPLPQKDVSVTVQIASGAGSLGGKTTAKSDANGRVSFTDLELQGETGSTTLIFAAEGFTPTTSAAISVGPGPPAPDRSSVSLPNGTAAATTTIVIQVADEFGNLVSGAGSLVTIEVTGANSASGLAVTDLGNGSYSASYVPIHTGADLVSVRVDGKALAGSPFQSIVVAGPADPATTTATLTRSGFLGSTIDAVITTRDAQGNLLNRGGDHVQVQWNGSSFLDATDNGDGTYSRSDFIGFGSLTATILLNGVPIAGSPFAR